MEYQPQAWNINQLRFAVREPFPSRASNATLVFVIITQQQPLMLASRMPENGVIFNDGIEVDFLDLNAGTEAIIGLAEREGCLVI